MQRRDFLKVAAITGTAGALDSCGNPEHQLIRFIPEEDRVPGVAEYKPSICTMCPAGCGLMVKVMEGDAEVIRNGQLGLIKMGLAKKLEGNPNHPINQGKLCPRGQAGLQVTYHPDRVRHPLKRTGPRGSGEFQEISWDEAIGTLVQQIKALQSAKQMLRLRCISRPLHGQRRELVELFLVAMGTAQSPVYFEPRDNAPLRFANAYSFGAGQLPTYDLANSNYVVSFGADFLGTWNSPVAQSIGFGIMRQGRAGRRGKFVQVESRMSLTGASADEWLPINPGTEGALALGLAYVIMRDKLKRPQDARRAGELIAGWADGLPDFSPPKVEQVTGVSSAKIERLAREMVSHLPTVAVVGDAPLAHTNAIFTGRAINALNALLGNIEQRGGIHFTPEALWTGSFVDFPAPYGSFGLIDQLVYPLLEGDEDAAKLLLLNDADPVFAMPASTRVHEALEKIPFIVSFGNFINDTTVLADLILPDHSPLESWVEHVAESGSIQGVLSVTPPAIRPLHNTRPMPDVLLQLATQVGGEAADRMSNILPLKTFEAMLAAKYGELTKWNSSLKGVNPEEFWKELSARGFWSTSEGGPRGKKELVTVPISKIQPKPQPKFWWRATQTMPLKDYEVLMAPRASEFHAPEFDGAEKDFPFHFLPYASQMLFDGSLAHLPWMQETPDPISTAMWGTWVEINPKTAERLEIVQGDLLEVASQHGKIQAPALIYPGIAPDTVAMPVGQGHEHFTRYASGRGANPISILAPVAVPETGSLAWAATRVKISKVGKGKLVLFAGGLREHPLEEGER